VAAFDVRSRLSPDGRANLDRDIGDRFDRVRSNLRSLPGFDVRPHRLRTIHVALREPVEGFRSARVRSWVNRGMRWSDEDLSIPIPSRADPDELMRSIEHSVPRGPGRPIP